MDGIEKTTLIDALEQRLRTEIFSGRYAAGALLPPERELARSYAVTRASLKQSLVRLEKQGLIETQHGVGSRVQAFAETGGADLLPSLVLHEGPEVIPEVLEGRKLIGALIARRAALRRGAADRKRLEQLRSELHQIDDTTLFHERENQLHRLLARASDNRVFLLLVNSMLRGYDPVRRKIDAIFEARAAVLERIDRLVAAVCEGDADAAEAAALDYYDETGRRTLRALGLRSPLKKRRRRAPHKER